MTIRCGFCVYSLIKSPCLNRTYAFIIEPTCHAEFISASKTNQNTLFERKYLLILGFKILNVLKRAYHNYWVYIITNKPRGVLYIGVTGGIDDRMERHVAGIGSKFSKKYKLKILVYFEEFQYINDAIKREKQLKNWHRDWKINLIEKNNPEWINLWSPLGHETPSG